MRRTADKVDKDDGFLRRANAGGRLAPQQLRQGQAADAERANLEELSP